MNPVHPVAAPVTAHDRHLTQLHAMAHELATSRELLIDLCRHVESLIPSVAMRAPTLSSIMLAAPAAGTGAAYILRTLGYRHNALWLGAAATVYANVFGVGSALSLLAGWNRLDLPEGTELTVAAATTPAVLALSDWKLGQ